MSLAIAAAIGAAVILLMLGGKGWFMDRFRADTLRLRDTWLRFSPDPVNAEVVVLVIYGIYLGLLGALVGLGPNIFVALGMWALLLYVPKLIIEMLWKSRRKKIDHQLPPAIAAMANSMRAGLTLVQALERLGETAPEPIRTEFKIMASRYSYGADLESTITEAKQRLSLANFNLFASALLLNREMGGDIGATLSRISQSLDKLHQMRKTVEAHTSEGRTNIKVLLVAPIFMLLMMATVDPEAVGAMFTTRLGQIILLIAACLTLAGVYFAARITRSEV